jgi:hypothetical protein
MEKVGGQPILLMEYLNYDKFKRNGVLDLGFTCECD